MAHFLIRPELNNAKEGDYDRLHDAMYMRKAYKVIKLDDGTWRDLPTGTYDMENEGTNLDVYTVAVAALNSIGKVNSGNRRDFELIVCKRSGSHSDLRYNTDKSKLPPNA